MARVENYGAVAFMASFSVRADFTTKIKPSCQKLEKAEFPVKNGDLDLRTG